LFLEVKIFRQYKTFFGDDIWNALTEQAKFDNVLDDSMTVNAIAASWITKDRLPVINVTRDYKKKTVSIAQVCRNFVAVMETVMHNYFRIKSF
jgi:aminopeptidase N